MYFIIILLVYTDIQYMKVFFFSRLSDNISHIMFQNIHVIIASGNSYIHVLLASFPDLSLDPPLSKGPGIKNNVI